MDGILEILPPSVLAPERQRRVYLNAVLARAEVSSAYTPARKLWLRERRGEYVPNPALGLRQVDEHGVERWTAIAELLRAEVNQRHAPFLEEVFPLRDRASPAARRT